MIGTKKFQQLILDYYQKNKRNFPWRQTSDPYKILVSEIMLQQTQTHRVLPKYLSFIEKFPTINSLANSSLLDVLQIWNGLGYNRRAKYLHQAAQYLQVKVKGGFPSDAKSLQLIPGIGPYTAAAIITFAFNKPLPFIETNIRRVYLHHFFPHQTNISDKQLLPLIEQTLDQSNPKEWYYALMDYGSNLAKEIPNPNRKSKHYTKQSKFEGSVRKVRGEIIRQLLINSPQQINDLTTKINNPLFKQAVQGLKKDNLIEINDTLIKLTS